MMKYVGCLLFFLSIQSYAESLQIIVRAESDGRRAFGDLNGDGFYETMKPRSLNLYLTDAQSQAPQPCRLFRRSLYFTTDVLNLPSTSPDNAAVFCDLTVTDIFTRFRAPASDQLLGAGSLLPDETFNYPGQPIETWVSATTPYKFPQDLGSNRSDVNFDGYDDFVGYTRVYSGKDMSRITNITREEVELYEKQYVDVNGDGVAEILQAQPDIDTGNYNKGQIRVLDGVSRAEIKVFNSVNFGLSNVLHEFGATFAVVDDMDSDGFQDIAASSKLGNRAHLVVFSYASGALLGHKTSGLNEEIRVFAALDVDGDGVSNIILSDNATAQQPDALFALEDEMAIESFEQDNPSWDAVWIQDGGAVNDDYFAEDACDSPDLTGDGVRDLIVSRSNHPLLVPGQLHVVSGADGSIVADHEVSELADNLGIFFRCLRERPKGRDVLVRYWLPGEGEKMQVVRFKRD